MLRKLVDYKKLDLAVAAKLIESYPHGYGDSDIIVFKNAHGETVEAVEIRTETTIYLVKISKSLSNFIATFDDKIEKELEASPMESNDTDVLETSAVLFEDEIED